MSLLIGIDGGGGDDDDGGGALLVSTLLPQAQPCNVVVWRSSSRARGRRLAPSREASPIAAYRSMLASRRKISNTTSDAQLVAFFTSLPDMIATYKTVMIFGAAPRSALSTSCSRALRIMLLGLNKTRLVWVDLTPEPPKAATLSFCRSLSGDGGSLLVASLARAHLNMFRPETLPIQPANTVTILRSALFWPDGSSVSVQTFNIKAKINACYAVDAFSCRKSLITSAVPLDATAAWIVTRRVHDILRRITMLNRAIVVQFDGLWGIMFPVSDAAFFVHRVDAPILSELDQFDLLPIGEFPVVPHQSDDAAFCGDMLSTISEYRAQTAESLVEMDIESMEHQESPVIARLNALRRLHQEKTLCPNSSIATNERPLDTISALMLHIVNGEKDIDAVISSIRQLEKLQRSDLMDKSSSQTLMVRKLSTALLDLQRAYLAQQQPARIRCVQLQIVIVLEIAKLSNSVDPIHDESWQSLRRSVATLSVLFLGVAADGLERFLNKILYKWYGIKFPLTLLEIYDDMDVHPPHRLSEIDPKQTSNSISPNSVTPILADSDTLGDDHLALPTELPIFPIGMNSNHNSEPLQDGAALVNMISEEESFKRRRTISSCYFGGSNRFENTLKWTRSFVDRDSKGCRSDSSVSMPTPSSFRDKHVPIRSRTMPSQILVEASPSRPPPRAHLSPRRRGCLSAVVLSVTESPPFKLPSESFPPIVSTANRVLSFDEPR